MAQSLPVDAHTPTPGGLEARSDLELVAAINGGDTAAFEVLYFRYRDWVTALACRICGDSDAALDVMQETFLYVLRKFPGFRLTANFKTFLYPAVRNLSIQMRRKSAKYQTAEVDLERLEGAPTEGSHANPSELSFVLAALPEEQREVLLLRFVDGLSLAEIAQAMSIPVGTVKSRLHHALNTLRQDPRTAEFFER